jgi:hypothetical protein
MNILQNLKQVKGIGMHCITVMPIVCLGGKERNVSQIVIDCLDSSLIKINVVARNFTQELSPFGYAVISQSYFSMVYIWT